MVYARLRYKVEEPSSLYGARDFAEADFYGLRDACVNLYDFFSFIDSGLENEYRNELCYIGVRKDMLNRELGLAIVNKKGFAQIKKLLNERSSLNVRKSQIEQKQSNNAEDRKRTYLDALAGIGFRQTSAIRDESGTVTEVFELQEDESLNDSILSLKQAFKNILEKEEKEWSVKYNLTGITEEAQQ